jgi:hypothetical protein
MTYIVERKSRFYVVAYDGLDPLSGRERRRWIPIGDDRSDVEAVVARLDAEPNIGPASRRGTVSVAVFLTRAWMPHKRRQVRATTAYRYLWFIEGHQPGDRLHPIATAAPITSTTSAIDSLRAAAGKEPVSRPRRSPKFT